MITWGPFAEEREAIAAAREFAAEQGADPFRAVGGLMLVHATVSVEQGAYDQQVIDWLAGMEPQMCASVAGLIRRAYEAGQPDREG